MKDYFVSITEEELVQRSRISLEVLETEDDVYHDMARVMFDEINTNNAKGKSTVFICPVGPVGQYKRFVRMVHLYKLSLKNVYIFNMDEYLDDNKQMIAPEHPLSFKGFMEREVYSKIDGELNVPVENRFFPEPGKESLIWEKICELGGVDISFGGIGVNGHIAFNEPPEADDNITDEAFRNLPTRILEISRETRTINAAMAIGGYIDAMPKWCITIGMKEILSAKKIRFYLFRDWQRGIVRQILHGPVTAKVPASFFQQHPDAKLTLVSNVVKQPYPGK